MSETTFDEILHLWLNAKKISLKGGSIAKYQNLIDKHISPVLGNVPISELSSEKVNMFLSSKIQEGRLNRSGGLDASYVKSMMLIVNSAHQFAVDRGLCKAYDSPIFKPLLSRKQLRILSLAEQNQLEKNLNAEINGTSVGILISLYAGLRIGEVCALSWEDVDLVNRVITVRHTIARVKDKDGKEKCILDTPKTPNSLREIPIAPSLYQILIMHRAHSKSLFVISQKDNFLLPRTYEYRYYRIMIQASIPYVNYHALRHTFATRCIEAGVDIKSLSEMLGHSNVSVTLSVYVHSSMELKRLQLEKLCKHTHCVELNAPNSLANSQ